MPRLSIVQIAGPYCGTHIEGEKLYHAVAPYLRADEQVILDFDNVELTSSSFFNELFNNVIEDFGERIVGSHISFDLLKPRHQFVLERTRPTSPA